MISLTKRYQELTKPSSKINEKTLSYEIHIKKAEDMTTDMMGKLREKKVNLINELGTESNNQRDKLITDMISKHSEVQSRVSNMMSLQTEIQNEEFNKKMTRRREKSINKSMNKSIDIKSTNKDDKAKASDLSDDKKEGENTKDILNHLWVKRRSSSVNKQDNIFKDKVV